MNNDDFEQRLRDQPLRLVPGGWRREILNRATLLANPGMSSGGWLRDLLWPHPLAWATLAAIWLVILGINSIGPKSPGLQARATAPETRTQRLALAEQRRLWLELIDPGSANGSQPNAGVAEENRPRSESDRAVTSA